MAFATFTPPAGASPDMRTKKSTQPRRITNKFGDGYTQTTGDGLNINPVQFTVYFDMLTPAQADQIESFMDARADGTPFYWTLPREASPRLLRWTSKERTYPYPLHDALLITMEEVFVA